MTGWRLEMRITGFGGQGVVLAAYIVGRASINDGKHATMIQSFGPEARGASCSATLVISPDEVLYPYIQRPSILVAMSSDGYEKFRHELTDDGVLIYESDLVKPVDEAPLGAPASSRPDRRLPGGGSLDALAGRLEAGATAGWKPALREPALREPALRGPALREAALREPALRFGIPSTRIAETLRKPMVQNIVMLGFIARVTQLVPLGAMRDAVRESVPAGTEEINLQAFDAGAKYFDEVEVPGCARS